MLLPFYPLTFNEDELLSVVFPFLDLPVDRETLWSWATETIYAN